MPGLRFIAYVVVCLFFMTMVYPARAEQIMVARAPIADLLTMSLDELVNIEVSLATGTPKAINRAPAVASVITAADIEHMGATTLDEVLETVPGLHVSFSSNGSQVIWSMRGIHTDINPQVALLINGIPLKKLYIGSKYPGFHYPVAAISKIEVIRGPGSAVQGADAFSGTVNIITKDNDEINGTVAGLRGGSFDTVNTWLQHGGNYRGWDLAVSLEMQSTQGDDGRIIIADSQTARDALAGTDASLAPGPMASEYDMYNLHVSMAKENLSLHLWGWTQNGGTVAGVASALDPRGSNDEEAFLFDTTYHTKGLVQDWDLGLRFSFSYYHDDAFLYMYPPGSILGAFTYNDGVIGNPITTDKVNIMEFSGIFTGFADHRLRLAGGIELQDLDTNSNKNYGPGVVPGVLTNISSGPYIFLNDQNREIRHLAMQDEWTFADTWELTAGIRYDHYSDFGETVNPRAALVWTVKENLIAKLLYGKAFRPPSFNELYSAINPVARGNPNLDPETIHTYEFALDYRPVDNLHTVLNVFHYDLQDLIEQVADNPAGTLRTAQNTKNVRGNGFEFEITWRPSADLMLKGNVAHQRSEDKATGEDVPDAPGLQFWADINWQFRPLWFIDAQYNWVGDRRRNQADSRPEVDDYDTVDLTLRRTTAAGDWGFALAARNVLDTDCREPILYPGLIPGDFPLAGRSIWAELRYAWQGK